MPKPYRFLLFDFVNTLFLPEETAVPYIEVEGKRVVSTAALLRERMPEIFGHLEVQAIYQAHRDAWTWVEAQRGEEHREIQAYARFQHLLALLGMPDAKRYVVETVVETHMEIVTGAFRLPPGHRDMLERLRRRFHLGILSNFDHAPPLRRLLAAHGIADWFDRVAVSADIGWRKPDPRAFSTALAGCPFPRHAVLHVGDTWIADVEGARGALLDAAWINLNGEVPPQQGRATFMIERLTQLEPLLD
jgi:putative hydrolase of the HAD superfamily